jgi:lysophospholipase
VPNNVFDVSAYISALRENDTFVPVGSLAISGGGARASLSGYGAWQALDERYPPSLQAGTGGIAQALTYLSGLSGGAGPTGGIAMSNFATVQQLLDFGSNTANITSSPANNPDPNIAHAALGSFLKQIGAKAAQGFNVSVTDIFSFVLASEFIYNQSAGLNTPIMGRTWSDIQGYSGFSEGQYPMPLVMANEVILPGIPDVTEFFGAVRPFYNASNNTIVHSLCIIR